MQASSMRSTTVQGRPSLAASRPASRVFAPIQCAATSRKEATQDRHRRLRRKLSGTEERPRLAVYRSNEHIYAQVIDDSKGQTLAAASTLGKEMKEALTDGTANIAAAEAVGKKIAELCSAKNITKVCFDRGGKVYHGRVKAVAEGARAAGLQF